MACGQIPGPSFLHPSDSGEGFLKQFGFREQPFGVTPDPSYLFFSEMHRSALQLLVNSIECNLGFAVLLGAPGMGKTSLLLKLLTQYRVSARTAFIFQTQCTPHDLLRHLASEFEIPSSNDEVLLHQRLKEMLVNEARAGRKVLVMIDEAQNLQDSSLEAIRLLSDFETRQAKLLHIVLAGSARLSDTLLTPELSQLAQRISTVCRLGPLGAEEVAAYITFRLERAGYEGAKNLFSAEALSTVAELSKGIPRVVNSLCLGALSLAYGLDERSVSSNLIRQAARNLDLSHPRTEGDQKNEPSPYSEISTLKTKGTALGQASVLPGFYGSAPERDTQFGVAEGTDAVTPKRNNDDRDEEETSSQPRSSPTQVAQRGQNHFTRTGRAGTVPVPFATVRGARSFKSNSFLPVFMALMLSILWVGWYQFRARSEAPGLYSTSSKQIGGPIEKTLHSTATASEMTLSNAQDMAAVEQKQDIDLAKHGTGDNTRTLPGREIVETLPQLLLPSRLPGRTVNATETGVPAKALAFGGSASLKSLLAPPSRPFSAPQPGISRVTNEPADINQTALGRPTKVVKPDYPKFAMLRHIEGDVILELRVNPDGHVQDVRTIFGKPILAVAAEDAARQFQYSPFPRNQVPAVTQVRFNFKLH
ncbi:MAG: TonB family protein, partial [Candidatus Angelobacter sp.]